MPLNPGEIRKKQAEATNPAALALMDRIDAAMREDFDGHVFRWGDLPKLRDAGACEHAVLSAYRAKGWKVQRISDQRDGDYWEFRPLTAEDYYNK